MKVDRTENAIRLIANRWLLNGIVYRLQRSQFIPRGIEEVWEFFSIPQNLNEMTPGFLDFEILKGGDKRMFRGQIIEYNIRTLPCIRQRWVSEITDCQNLSYFVDKQQAGPYRLWEHLHRFVVRNDGVEMFDRIDYELPFGPFGRLAHRLFVKRRLNTIFNYRAEFLEKRFKAADDIALSRRSADTERERSVGGSVGTRRASAALKS